MQRKLKLIWDFRGAYGFKTAEHHALHLREFASREKLFYHECNHETISDLHAIAYITVNESDMIMFRDALKPHRGTLAK